jgi:hypothetical protein
MFIGALRSLPYAAAAVLALGALAALRVAVASYRGERSDFTRWPPSEISRHPERTLIAGLVEVDVSRPGEPRVAAWYVPSRNSAAVVLVHGTGADRSSLLAETRLLAAGGFGVLPIDLPGQGQSRSAVPSSRRSSGCVPDRRWMQVGSAALVCRWVPMC